MELDNIIQKTQISGYKIEKGSEESTIKTKRGDVEVVLNEGRGQAHCYIGRNQIQLFRGNENAIEDLVHERDHFQIFPYDLISFGAFWGSALTYSVYKASEGGDWQNALIAGAAGLTIVGLHGLMGGINLVGDGIIYAREIFRLNRK